jgi:hypothetical protein
LRHLGGALLREQPGALSHLDGGYLLFAVGMPTGSVERAIVDEDLDRVRAAVAPSVIGAEYLNFGDEPGQMARSFPPATLEALARCRALTDPAGVSCRCSRRPISAMRAPNCGARWSRGFRPMVRRTWG